MSASGGGDFSTEASLLVRPEQSSLRSTKEEIEDALGDITVDVSAGGASGRRGSARSDGGVSSGIGPSRTGGFSASEPQGVSDILTESYEVQEAILIQLEDMADDGGLLGGGGMGGDVLNTILETGGDAAVEVGGEAIGTVSDAVTTGMGSAVGTAVGNAISGSSVSLENNTVGIDPEDVPLGVEETALAVEEVDALAVDAPTLAVDDPSPLGVDDPSPLSVESVPSIDVNAPDSIPVDVSINVSSSGASRDVSRRTGDGGGGGDSGNPWWDPTGWAGGVADDAHGWAEGVAEEVSIIGGGGSRPQMGGGPQRRRPTSSGRSQSIQIDNTSRIDVTVDPRGLREIEDAIDAVRDAHEDNIDDLEGEIDSLRSDFTRLQRNIRGN